MSSLNEIKSYKVFFTRESGTFVSSKYRFGVHKRTASVMGFSIHSNPSNPFHSLYR